MSIIIERDYRIMSKGLHSQVAPAMHNVAGLEIAKLEEEEKKHAVTTSINKKSFCEQFMSCFSTTTKKATTLFKNSGNAPEAQQHKDHKMTAKRATKFEHQEGKAPFSKVLIQQHNDLLEEQQCRLSLKLGKAIGNKEEPKIDALLQNQKIRIEKYHCIMAIEDQIEEQLLTRLLQRYLGQKHIQTTGGNDLDYADKVYELSKNSIKHGSVDTLLTILTKARIKTETVFEYLIKKLVHTAIKYEKIEHIEILVKYERVQENKPLKSEVLKMLKHNKTLLNLGNLIAELEEQEDEAVTVPPAQAVASNLLPTTALPLVAPEQEEKVAIGNHIPIDNTF